MQILHPWGLECESLYFECGLHPNPSQKCYMEKKSNYQWKDVTDNLSRVGKS